MTQAKPRSEERSSLDLSRQQPAAGKSTDALPDKSQKGGSEASNGNGKVAITATIVDENHPTSSSLANNLVSLCESSPDEFRALIESVCKHEETAAIVREELQKQKETMEEEPVKCFNEIIKPSHKAYYLVMHLVNFSDTVPIIQEIKGKEKDMTEYIESIKEDIANHRFSVDEKLERALKKQFEGVNLVRIRKNNTKQMTLLPPTPEQRTNGKSMEVAVAASIYCRYKLFEKRKTTPRVSELMGVDGSSCDEEVVLKGVHGLKNQFPLYDLPSHNLNCVYINAASAPYADVFFEVGEKRIGVQCKDVQPKSDKIRGRKLHQECEKVLSHERKPCDVLAIVAPNETNLRTVVHKEGKEAINKDFKEWIENNRLYLSNSLLHEAWKL